MTSEVEPKETILVVAAAILKAVSCLVGQRRHDDSLGGHWEFPGGKVEAGETLEAAVHREIAEELGTEIRILCYLGEQLINRADKDIRLHVFLTELIGPEPQALEHAALRWLSSGEFGGLPLAPADRFAVPEIERELNRRATRRN